MLVDQSRVIEGSGAGFTQIAISSDDWQLLSEVGSEFPETLQQGNEGSALRWLEEHGAQLRGELDAGLLHTLGCMSAGVQGYEVVLVTTEDPRNSIPRTPLDHLPPSQNRLYQPDIASILLTSAISPSLYGYGYTSQQHGVILNNMLVAASSRGLPNVASSTRALDMHTEDCSYSVEQDGGISPDVLRLHYFRNTEGVSTPISVPNANELDADLLAELQMPQFIIPTSVAQGGDANNAQLPFPVYYTDAQGRLSLRFNAQQMLSVSKLQTPSGLEAITAFLEHVRSKTTTLVLQPGDILYLNNRNSLHAKGPHTYEEPEGEGRWQRRLALTHDLGRIAPYFANNDAISRVVEPAGFINRIRTETI